jgi:tRNA threonylcarbamoyladenosine biosynthesis protein TsaE
MKTMTTMEITSVDELDSVAKELLEFAGDQKIIALFGEMGSGKTTLVRKMCQLLGAKENVSSPTFSLINEYKDKNGKSIFHFDFYRIESEKEAVDIGCEEYFDSNSLCLIEWPEKILNLLPHPYVKVVIRVFDTTRNFSFSHE